jgi:hypothetical protein
MSYTPTKSDKNRLRRKGRSDVDIEFWTALKVNAPDIAQSDELVAPMAKNVLDGRELAYIKENFGNLVVNIESDVNSEYQRREKKATARALTATMMGDLGSAASIEDVCNYLSERVHGLDEYFLSVKQSRSSRASNALERILEHLLYRLGYKFEAHPVVDGNPDWIFPSKQHYLNNPMECIVFTAKRTLRERWRQVTTEAAKGSSFFLGTIEDKFSTTQLGEMKDLRIQLVVPEDAKTLAPYDTASNVISYASFVCDYLDPKHEVWRRSGII